MIPGPPSSGAAVRYDGIAAKGKRMADVRMIRRLTQYRAWADRLTYDAVAALPPGEATKERPTLFKTMIGTLNHNLVIDLIWQGHLEGRDHGFKARNVVVHAELPALWSAQQAINRWYADYAASLPEAKFDEIVPFRFLSGVESAMTRGDMLLHVVNHGTYHRGWVADMFFQVPAKNPSTDIPDFVAATGYA
jgi:uncharacterized damage-inducible protein DinB